MYNIIDLSSSIDLSQDISALKPHHHHHERFQLPPATLAVIPVQVVCTLNIVKPT